MANNSEQVFMPEENPQMIQERKSSIRLGLVANDSESEETRFFLTPEASGMVSSMGYEVVMESGASIDISYSDEDYVENDVRIALRDEVLQSDIVLSVRPLSAADVRKMKAGATLLGLFDSAFFEPGLVDAMLESKVTCVCLDNMYSSNGVSIFANILDEIDGRAAVMYAQEGLSFLGEGKGVLLAGVAGINPCEVLIIGEGCRVQSAAKAAIAAGAKVTLMDNDVSSLAEAEAYCGDRLYTACIHPRVLYNKVKSADVIMLDRCTRTFEFPKQLSVAMKESVYLIDIEDTKPSLSVPRTVAMAISNVMINFLNECLLKGGMSQMIATTEGVKAGVVMYRGKLVDKLIGMHLGIPCVDLNMMSTGSN